MRRRPIPRCSYQWKREPKEASLRFELILNGAVRVYPDGREVCQDSKAGWAEYKRRVEAMLLRQNWRCSLCGKRLSLRDATFEHQRRRGIGAAWRQDAIVDSEGNWIKLGGVLGVQLREGITARDRRASSRILRGVVSASLCMCVGALGRDACPGRLAGRALCRPGGRRFPTSYLSPSNRRGSRRLGRMSSSALFASYRR